MRFWEIDIAATSQGIEVLTGILEELGVSGMVVSDPRDFEEFLNKTQTYWDYVDESLMELRDAAPQLVLSDLNLPGFCAEEALQMVRAHDPRLPFVLLTGTPAIALPEPLPGTDGLLSKDDLQQLPDLVRQLLR